MYVLVGMGLQWCGQPNDLNVMSLEGFPMVRNLEQHEVRGLYGTLLMCTTRSLRKAHAEECERRECCMSL